MEEAEIARLGLMGMLIGYVGFFSPKGAWLGIAFFYTLVWWHN